MLAKYDLATTLRCINRIIHITLPIIRLLKQSFTHESVLAGAKVTQFCGCEYHGHIALCLQRSCRNLCINNTKHTHSMLMEGIHFHARKPHKHNCIIEEYCCCIIIPYCNNTNFILCIPFYIILAGLIMHNSKHDRPPKALNIIPAE